MYEIRPALGNGPAQASSHLKVCAATGLYPADMQDLSVHQWSQALDLALDERPLRRTVDGRKHIRNGKDFHRSSPRRATTLRGPVSRTGYSMKLPTPLRATYANRKSRNRRLTSNSAICTRSRPSIWRPQ